MIQGNDNAEVVFKDIDFDGDQNNNRSNPFFIVKSGTLTLDHVNVHDFCVSSQDGSFARIDGGTLQMQNGCTVNDCKSRNGVFYVASKGTLSVVGDISHPITFFDCHSTAGGIIYNNGSLSIDYAVFQKNTADNSGGALFNNGTSVISHTTFNENSTKSNYNNSFQGGGAIYNESPKANLKGSVELSHCRFEHNASGYYGGAVNNHGTFNGTDLTFENNSSKYCGGAVSNYATFDGSSLTFENNTAQNGNAMHVSSQKIGITEKSVVNLTDCQTAENQIILIDSNKVTLCGGTYSGSIQLGTAANCVTVKKTEASQDIIIKNLNLATEQFLKYGGGFSAECRIDFDKPEESITIPEQIVQGQLSTETDINAFHLKNENYQLILTGIYNNALKAVPKAENPNNPDPSINYTDETLSFENTDIPIQCKTNDANSQWQSCQNPMPLTDLGWDGSQAVDIAVRYAATKEFKPSVEAALTVPTRGNAPTGFIIQDESVSGAADGVIQGISDRMEYRIVSDDENANNPWIDVSTSEHFNSSTKQLINLSPGKYQLRTKASEQSFASFPSDVFEIKQGQSPTEPTVVPEPEPSHQINYVSESFTSTADMSYLTDDGKWLPCENNMPLESFGWNGSAALSVTLRDKNGLESVLTIPPRPAAIKDGVLSAVDETVFGEGGTINGVSDKMEYRDTITQSENETWNDCAVSPHFDKAASTLTHMPSGDYQFRTKATTDTFAGMPVTLTIHAAKRPIPTAVYHIHGRNYGWSQDEKTAGEVAGTTGLPLRAEAIRLRLIKDNMPNQQIGVSYRVHMANIGWSDFYEDGETAGTTGECRRIEAFEATLTGEGSENYNLWYRVHAKDIGWMPWKKNGETAGTTGQSRRIEAIEIKILSADDTIE